MLGARVFRWTGVFRAGIVRWERKGDQTHDLTERRRFERKKAEVTIQAAYRFKTCVSNVDSSIIDEIIAVQDSLSFRFGH
jgi:hypothetical protein